MTNWVQIDPIFTNFTPELQKLWEEYSFSQQETKEWLSIGLQDYEFGLANYLKSNGYVAHLPFEEGVIEQWREYYNSLNFSEIISTNPINTEINNNQDFSPFDVFLTTNQTPISESLINSEPVKQDWKDIHQDFSDYYQKKWEENSLTYQGAKEWITIGFAPYDHNKVKGWKDQGFTIQQVQEWMKAGLENDEYELATWLKNQNITPNYLADKLKNNRDAQGWVDIFYPLEQRATITKLDISNKNLTGSLIISDWDSLQEINCGKGWRRNESSGNQITNLTIDNCPQLTKIICSNNQLTTLILPAKTEKLTHLNISNNKLTDLSIFSNLVNLTGKLDLSSNNFSGSLEPLKNLTKLKAIEISNTNIDSGLEHLPENIEKVHCADSKRSSGSYKIWKMLKGHSFSPKEWKEKEYLKQQLELLKSQPNTNSIEYLQQRIKELESLISKHKQKIVDAYLFFAPDKELLKKLINSHLEYIGTKKKGLPSVKLKKQKEKFYNELETKIGEEAMEEVEAILNDCEELIGWEFELETKQAQKQLYLEGNNSQPQISSVSQLNLERMILDSDQNSRPTPRITELPVEVSVNSIRSKKPRKRNSEDEKLVKRTRWEDTSELNQVSSSQQIRIVEMMKESSQSLTQVTTVQLSLTSQNVNKPTLERLLGRGAHGEVYYGKWKLQEVAVKKFYLTLDNISQADRDNINQEIQIIQNLRNRYIIQYYDSYSDQQEIYLIMDYAENGTLTKFINDRQGQVSDWQLNQNLIKQMSHGLAYIHHQHIIHRDLKSQNILLTHSYQIKISDFGLSKVKTISSQHSKNNAAGTLRWMPPEVLREQRYSEWSDIYSLGMVIWELAAHCTTPFKGIDQTGVLVKILSHGQETIPIDTPINIRSIITNCWNQPPEQRISLKQILEELNSSNQQYQFQIQIPPK